MVDECKPLIFGGREASQVPTETAVEEDTVGRCRLKL
jgi:hypothetical protein